MVYGAIYIAHNPRDGDNVFKVGKTQCSVDERMRQLTSSTSNLGTYAACAYFVVYDIDEAEEACHRALRRYRVQDNREFYELPLSRLIRIVTEQVQQYGARNYVPSIESEDSTPTKQLGASEMLKSARERRAKIDELWDQALASAIVTLSEWSSLIRNRALQSAGELKDEKIIKWEILEGIDLDKAVSHFVPLCSVKFFCLFLKKPLALEKRGFRGGTYGTPDLSRAIGEPKPISGAIGDKEGQYIRWDELDDGRIGRLELVATIEHGTSYYREKAVKPLPKVIVNGYRIHYDDYHEKFEEYNKQKSYNDPIEAFEVFLELVAENAKTPQFDVREVMGEHKPRYGPSRPKIYDKGKFEMGVLEK